MATTAAASSSAAAPMQIQAGSAGAASHSTKRSGSDAIDDQRESTTRRKIAGLDVCVASVAIAEPYGGYKVMMAALGVDQFSEIPAFRRDVGPRGQVRGHSTGLPLPAALVSNGRETECTSMDRCTVYDIAEVPAGAHAVGTQWLDDWKWSEELQEWIIRSRLVAMQFNDDERNNTYAGTPGGKGIKLVISLAASKTARGTRPGRSRHTPL